jgi:hypothetical protein
MAGGASTDPDVERWLAVLLRSVHLAGVVWVGAALVAGVAVPHGAGALMLASGLVMAVMDLRAGRLALREVAGAFVLLKLLLVAWMVFDPRQASWLFWTLLVASSVASHAPKGFRHWPNRGRSRANGGSEPG